MKTYLVILGTMILIGLTVGCGLVDDASRVAPKVIDDVPRVIDDVPKVIDDVPKVIDEIPRVINPVDDTARSWARSELNYLSSWADNLSPEQRETLESTILSTSCLFLMASIEGRDISYEELLDHIAPKIVVIFNADMEEIVEAAKYISENLLNSDFDQATLADYCDELN
jgi:hypothetical protein